MRTLSDEELDRLQAVHYVRNLIELSSPVLHAQIEMEEAERERDAASHV